MNLPRRLIVAALVIVVGIPAALACTKSVQKQLESAARDWSAMVRASQIIPVYPLTEDIQPGDVFLVQVPIDRQQEIYRTKGYLPLDNHLSRINPDSYTKFYDRSFELKNDTVPRDLLDRGGDRKKAWRSAPAAAFPTYSFAVKKSKGFNLAIPLQGVPVGLSLLQSNEAVGSVSIRDARTVGVDILPLHAQLVNEWLPLHRAELADYAPVAPNKANRHNYLRIITRVYLTGEVDISMRDTSAFGGGADVGAPKPSELSMANLDTLNSALKDATGAAPGGSVRVTSASARTIGLKETLVPPLTIGYLGFDVEILEGGELGPAIPTHALLTKMAEPSSGPANMLVGAEARYADSVDAATARPDGGKSVFRAAAGKLGPDWLRLYDKRLGSGDDYSDAFGDLALVYWSTSDRSVDAARQNLVAEALKNALGK